LFVNGSELNEQSLWRTFQGCFLPNFDSFGKAVLEEMIFLEINHSETRIACRFKKKSSPLKLLDQMNRNLVGSIYGTSSIKIAQFVPIG
jgi:hypothetical protein